MAWHLDQALVRITDANGDAINGGKLYVFAAGTTTPSTIYSNNALTLTHANPVVADSGGLIAECWLAAGSYKLRYTDADGTTIQEIDNFVVPDLTGLSTLNWPVVSKTADYTITSSDKNTIFAVDASSAPGSLVTITANATNLTNGFNFMVINVGSTGTVTVTPGGGETINGAASLSLAVQYKAAMLSSRGAAGWWNVLANVAALDSSIAFTGDISPSEITGDQNDYNPTGLSTASVLRLDVDAQRTVTGLQGGSDGRIFLVNNIDTSNDLILANDSASSTAANRILTFNSAGATIAPLNSALLIYDSTSSRWRVLLGAPSMAGASTMETATSFGHFVPPGHQHRHPGHPKCWGEFLANSTTIETSYNITSVADTATGQMTVTIATDFSSVDWACLITRAEDDLTLAYSTTYSAKAAGTVVLNSVVEAGGGSDPSDAGGNASWSMVGFGDHA